jgi:hypothetical protein
MTRKNRISLTRDLYNLVFGSYKCLKKCNATYDAPCMSMSGMAAIVLTCQLAHIAGSVLLVTSL